MNSQTAGASFSDHIPGINLLATIRLVSITVLTLLCCTYKASYSPAEIPLLVKIWLDCNIHQWQEKGNDLVRILLSFRKLPYSLQKQRYTFTLPLVNSSSERILLTNALKGKLNKLEWHEMKSHVSEFTIIWFERNWQYLWRMVLLCKLTNWCGNAYHFDLFRRLHCFKICVLHSFTEEVLIRVAC